MGAGGYVGEAQEPVDIPCGQARGQAQPVHRLSSRVVHGPSEASWAVAQRSSTYPRVPPRSGRALRPATLLSSTLPKEAFQKFPTPFQSINTLIRHS